jgi:hypothetical protein
MLSERRHLVNLASGGPGDEPNYWRKVTYERLFADEY